MVVAPSSIRSVNGTIGYLLHSFSFTLSFVGELGKLPRFFQYKFSTHTLAQLLSTQFLRFVHTKIDYRVNNKGCQRSRPHHPQVQESQFSREQ
jgi:hypothetical protein